MPARTSNNTVYPRVYGGTLWSLLSAQVPSGLSPRVRGNLPITGITQANARSIPACTGEPFAGSHQQIPSAVYPRVYGGTEELAQFSIAYLGLSPRVRGNRCVPAASQAV